MIPLSFRQTPKELLLRAAATLLFAALKRSGARLVELRELIEGTQYGYTESASEIPVGPRFLRITDLKGGSVDWQSVPFCKCSRLDQYQVFRDDLLFARTGATTGKTHLVTELPSDPVVFASYLIRVRPKRGVIPGFLAAFFLSDLYWEQIVERKEGSAQANVNGDKLSRLKLPIAEKDVQTGIADFIKAVHQQQSGAHSELPALPQPLTDQRRVMQHLAVLDEANRVQEEVTKELRALTAALWDRAFRGEL